MQLRRAVLYGCLGICGAILHSSNAAAEGFDLHNLWSGKYTGLGGAAASSVDGAQSIYFNPAGLSKTGEYEYSFDVGNGLIFNQASPLIPGQPAITGSDIYIPIIGLFYSHKITERLGLGLGAYISGGTGGNYESVDFGPQYSLKPTFKTTLIILETGAALGYELAPGIRVGASWRPTFIKLDSQIASSVGNVLFAPQLNGLTDFVLNSFRFGVQYFPDSNNWGMGTTLRTAVDFSASGTSSGTSQIAGSATTNPITGGNAVAKSKIPMELSFGAHLDFSQHFRLLTQYDFIRSAQTKSIALSGDPLLATGLPAIPISALSIPLGWKNTHTIRLGGQYTGYKNYAFRAGYVLSTQITPSDQANPFLTAPGLDHTVDIGAGKNITLFGHPVDFDVALEYNTASGPGRNSQPPSLDGTYTAKSFGLYLGITHRT